MGALIHGGALFALSVPNPVMKKVIKPIIVLLLLTATIAGTYFIVVLNSRGTKEITYLESDPEYASFSDILQHPDLKGKVVYVDYWHTGCAPCLKEFEHMAKLKDQFKESEDLAFLYLGKDRSVPGEKFRWKKDD
jgi:thiol-disulfide isomerase/thioredoxin